MTKTKEVKVGTSQPIMVEQTQASSCKLIESLVTANILISVPSDSSMRRMVDKDPSIPESLPNVASDIDLLTNCRRYCVRSREFLIINKIRILHKGILTHTNGKKTIKYTGIKGITITL